MLPSFSEGFRSRSAILASFYLLLGGLVMVAIRHALMSADAYTRIVPQGIVSWWVVVVVIFMLLLVGLASRRLTTRSFYEFLFGIALFLGVWVYFWDIMPWDIGLLVASLATLGQAYVRRVIVHDLYILVGAAGIAIHFAFLLSQGALAAALVGFVIYDIVVGRAGGMAEALTVSFIRRGAIPGLIIPGDVRSFLSQTAQAVKEPGSMFLGAGDLILPMALLARVSADDWRVGVFVAIGILLGALWLGMRKSPKTFPALLPLLAGGGLGLMIAFLIHI